MPSPDISIGPVVKGTGGRVLNKCRKIVCCILSGLTCFVLVFKDLYGIWVHSCAWTWYQSARATWDRWPWSKGPLGNREQKNWLMAHNHVSDGPSETRKHPKADWKQLNRRKWKEYTCLLHCDGASQRRTSETRVEIWPFKLKLRWKTYDKVFSRDLCGNDKRGPLAGQTGSVCNLDSSGAWETGEAVLTPAQLQHQRGKPRSLVHPCWKYSHVCGGERECLEMKDITEREREREREGALICCCLWECCSQENKWIWLQMQ